jgi:hypothetical protein
MIKTRISGLFLLLSLLGVLGGCSTVTWVNDISTTPDGNRVDVVGAQYQIDVFGDISPDKPVRWVCSRNEQGRLSCKPDTTDLPQSD